MSYDDLNFKYHYKSKNPSLTEMRNELRSHERIAKKRKDRGKGINEFYARKIKRDIEKKKEGKFGYKKKSRKHSHNSGFGGGFFNTPKDMKRFF